MLGWLFGNKAEREAKQLNRDVPVILEQARSMFSEQSMRVVADLTLEHINRAHNIYGSKTIDFQRALFDYKKLHKDARGRSDQRALSAMTLVIIYLRSEIVGETAAPARSAIEDFVKSTISGEFEKTP
jgi:hypothetical protein